MTLNVTICEATPDDAQALIEQVRLLTEEPNIDIQPGPDELTLTEEQERQVLAEYVAGVSPVFWWRKQKAKSSTC